MNKKLFAVIALVLFILLLVFLLGKGIGSVTTKVPVKTDPSVEKRISWSQKEFSVSTFTTREDPEGQVKEDKQTVHIVFTGFFNFSSTVKIKSMTITKVRFTQKVGKQVFIHPPHKGIASSRSYTFEPNMERLWAKNILDGGNIYTLKVVNESPKYYDEVFNMGGSPNFAFITKNIGTVSEQTILDKDKVYSSAKALQYLGIKAEDLDGDIIIDVHITFDDGKKYMTRMSGEIEGLKILNETFYTIKMDAL